MIWKVVFTPDARHDVKSGRDELRESSVLLAERFFEDA